MSHRASTKPQRGRSRQSIQFPFLDESINILAENQGCIMLNLNISSIVEIKGLLSVDTYLSCDQFYDDAAFIKTVFPKSGDKYSVRR